MQKRLPSVFAVEDESGRTVVVGWVTETPVAGLVGELVVTGADEYLLRIWV